ncbi:restriction endonuclease subunit S [Pseudomonas aeruginosa]|jgi:type I restriction enzyme S subunit|nr:MULTISPECIES: hypothetical protein [Pseudomonas]AOT40366.1 hypothetical protein BHE76_25245 [Pseudomonas aeruginosa]AZM85543.1 restriction endonuclease subunit S [Pseudomonas aeruginosa]EIU7109939.1 hypothetical protein [Pseudomonas aeruginosa]EJA2568613.1 hypothetical protein [Pseudomonas aeruginosa]EKL8567457.1 hypothetical protein [Pseudomonas aeruginosa]
MFAKRYRPDELIEIIAAQSYSPEIVAYVKKVANQPTLANYLKSKPKLGVTGTIAKDYVEATTPNAVPYISTKQVKGLHAYIEDAKYISKEADIEWKKCRVDDGDIVINKSGDVGAAAVLCCAPYKYVNSVSDIISIKLSETAPVDRDFLVVYLNSPYGQKQLQRLSGGAIFSHVSLHAIPHINVYAADVLAQKYIGDKVRQAERLRAWATTRGEAIGALVANEAMRSACAATEKQHNRPQLEDLSHRLDPKYYGNRAVAVFRQAKALGKPLSSLVKTIANGFEERIFFNEGRDYITVTEVSSGRLDLSSAPKIAYTTEVPDKAIIHERCALIVRTGSIGTAVKVDVRDRGAVISSHLIRLEFEDEAAAAAVAAYFCSPAGKILQHKISYGAVQPQIGQDELLALPIPQFVLDAKEQILALVTEQERAIRASKSLTTAAKYLVESLIEGQLTEAELLTAEKALQAGNDRLDRVILSRLNTDGIDGQGPVLFGDLGELYQLLSLAEGD